MPKRKNPFGEITPLQLKTHVGFEQMATQQEREQVYGESALQAWGSWRIAAARRSAGRFC